MTRPKLLTALLLSSVATLALGGCRTTVIEPVQPVRHDDRHDDRNPPPPPDHHPDHP